MPIQTFTGLAIRVLQYSLLLIDIASFSAVSCGHRKQVAMAETENGPGPPYAVIDLAAVRERLRVPTLLVAYLAQRIGTQARIRHPGLVEVSLSAPDGETETLQVRVKALDVAAIEAEARLLARQPFPERVFLDLRQCERKPGR